MKTFPQKVPSSLWSNQLTRPVLPTFPQSFRSLCPTWTQSCPQVIHPHVGGKGTLRPNILCLGLDKPKSRSYHSTRYIEALGHKWRACSGASCIPKRISKSTHPTSSKEAIRIHPHRG